MVHNGNTVLCVIEKHFLVNSLATNKPRMCYQDGTLISKNVLNSSLSKMKLLLNQHQCMNCIGVEACTAKGIALQPPEKIHSTATAGPTECTRVNKQTNGVRK